MYDVYKLTERCFFFLANASMSDAEKPVFLHQSEIISRIEDTIVYKINQSNMSPMADFCVHDQLEDVVHSIIMKALANNSNRIQFEDFVPIKSISDFLVVQKRIASSSRLFAINTWGPKEIIKGDGTKREALRPVNFFYRGISDFRWDLKPSALRGQTQFASVEEKYWFREYYDAHYSETRTMRLIDILFSMQHSGVPTRLLDVTQNPLVGLYMACRENTNKIGELIVFSVDDESIKPSNSFQIEINAALSLLSENEKTILLIGMLNNQKATCIDEIHISEEFNESDIELFRKAYRKLLRNIRKFNPLFEDDINLQLLLRSYLVFGNGINPRMIAQDGSFILSGLLPSCSYSIGNPYDHFEEIDNYIKTSRNWLPRIFIVNKKQILEELRVFRITEDTMFPDKYTESIKTRLINRWIYRRQ